MCEMQDAGDLDEYTRGLARRFYTSREESWKGHVLSLMIRFYPQSREGRQLSSPSGRRECYGGCGRGRGLDVGLAARMQGLGGLARDSAQLNIANR